MFSPNNCLADTAARLSFPSSQVRPAANPNNCSVYDPAARSKPGRGGCVPKWCSFGCRKKIKKVEKKT